MKEPLLLRIGGKWVAAACPHRLPLGGLMYRPAGEGATPLEAWKQWRQSQRWWWRLWNS